MENLDELHILAKINVQSAVGDAGDASGSADQAAWLFGRGDIAEAAERMKLAREQAQKAMHSAEQAEFKLRQILSSNS